MKRFLSGSFVLIALATSAQAADLPLKAYTKAPPADPVYNWTGFYLSGGLGYGMWAADQASYYFGPAEQQSRAGGRGWFGTVGGGYDWQLNQTLVAGIFADAQFGDIKGTLGAYDGYYSGSTSNKTNYAVGARLGYLIAPNVLSYINAGYSHADFSATNLQYFYSSTSSYSLPKQSLDGWFLGGGFENSLGFLGFSAPGWFMKTEYRIAEYDRKTSQISNIGGAPYPGWTYSMRPYVQTVSTSLVYRFNSGAVPAYQARTNVAPAHVKWDGFYLSGGGGYGMWDADQQPISGGTAYVSQRMGGRGYFGTVGGGYDRQFNWLNSSWVAGIFADGQFGDIKGSADYAYSSYTYTGNTTNKTSYAAGARLGLLVAPNVLSYVNVGYSHADFSGSGMVTYSGTGGTWALPKRSFDGWFLGGGVENSLNMFGIAAPGWFMKTEYRVAEYERKNTDLIYSDGLTYSGYSINAKPYVQTVSTSLVYRFNSGQ